MNPELHYTEPRLVSLYDSDNPLGIDSDFFLSLADDIDAKIILDLGCGTGLLTREFFRSHRNVTGIDPSIEMITYAKKQSGSENINWIVGDASYIDLQNVDLLVMTGNVSQVFLDDKEWTSTLEYIHDALRPGGILAFESRNPNAKAWETWIPANTHEIVSSPFGPIETWLDLVSVSNNLVHFQAHNIFKDTGEVLIVNSTLRFRSQKQFSNSLTSSGFKLKNTYGSWTKDAFTPTDPLMIFVAERI